MSDVVQGNRPGHWATALSQFIDRVQDGQIPPEFALGGLNSIMDGSLAVREIPIWKTIETDGKIPSAASLKRKMDATGCKFNFEARHLLEFGRLGQSETSDGSNGSVKKLPTRINFLLAKPRDFFPGLNRPMKRERFYRYAEVFGFGAVPSVALPLLRVDYLDQQPGEWLYVATPAMWNSRLLQVVFRFGRRVAKEDKDQTLLLEPLLLSSREMCNPDEVSVFMKT